MTGSDFLLALSSKNALGEDPSIGSLLRVRMKEVTSLYVDKMKPIEESIEMSLNFVVFLVN